MNHRCGISFSSECPAAANPPWPPLWAKLLGREVVEADELISQRAGMSIPEIFARSGEETFRKLETEVLAEQGKRSGIILSTGGGCVTQAENYPLLHKRHHFPSDPRPCQAANGGPSHFPNHRPRSALRPPGAAVPPLCRRDGVQRRGAGGHGTNH